MKVTSQPGTKASLDRKSEQTARDERAGSGQPNNITQGGATAGRKFASVLDDVMRAPAQRDKDQPAKEPRKTAEARQPSQQKTKQMEESEEEFIQALNTNLAPAAEPRADLEITGPREILHIADLEKIALAVRAQVVEGAQPQVILELPRSVLEGLRVRLSANGPGKITAEFLVRDEGIKAQIDAHSAGLADMLRSRGINLEALKTSVSADLSDRNGSNNQQRHFEAPQAGTASPVSAPQPAASPVMDESESISNTLYRA